MVDDDPHPGAVQLGCEGHQLVVDDLHVGDHVQRGEVGEEPVGVGVVLDAEHRRPENEVAGRGHRLRSRIASETSK